MTGQESLRNLSPTPAKALTLATCGFNLTFDGCRPDLNLANVSLRLALLRGFFLRRGFLRCRFLNRGFLCRGLFTSFFPTQFLFNGVQHLIFVGASLCYDHRTNLAVLDPDMSNDFLVNFHRVLALFLLNHLHSYLLFSQLFPQFLKK